jgi:hypothetical protein
MTKVERLKRIQDQIGVELQDMGPGGGTGYLDRPITPTSSVMKGTDSHGRAFVTLCLKSIDRAAGYPDDVRVGVITVFQRYSGGDPSRMQDIVVQARNGGTRVNFIEGAATDEMLTALQELVTTGRTQRTYSDTVAGDALTAYFELVPPEQALAG